MRAPGGEEPGSDVRSRLRRALTEALKARDAGATSALRSALGAIGNAEAVDADAVGTGVTSPGGSGSAHFAGAAAGLGAGEAPRRPLTEADVAAIVRAEAAEREAAAGQYEGGGRAEQAAGLRHGARALLSALDDGQNGRADGGTRP